MKTLIHKAAAVLLAVATMFGMAGLGALTANADDVNANAAKGTITVNTVQGFAVDDKGEPKPLRYYTMFTATVTPQSDTTDASVTYTLTDAWQKFFTDGTATGTPLTETSTELSKKAVEYIQGLSDTALADFARKAETWAEKNVTGNDVKTVTPGKDAEGHVLKTVEIKGLDYGYYLIAPDKAQVTVDGTYNPLLVDLTTTDHVSIQLKHEFPTIDKTVEDKHATDKHVGDIVTYKLSSTVAANMKDYNNGYVFTFHDTLSKGLTLVKNAAGDALKDDLTDFDATVKIAGNANALIKGTDYDVTAKKDATTGKTTITVAMKDLKNKHPEAAGKEITVEYSAKLNADAVTGTAGNTNSAQIEYSNDPNSNQTGYSVPSEVKVHTFEFTIDKYKFTSDNVYNESSERLGGAKFKVYANNHDADKNTDSADTSAALKFDVTDGGGNTVTTAKYDKSKQNEADWGTSELVTPAYGRILVSGLESGIYWLEETEAPQGYNKLTHMIKVVINATYDQTTGKLTSWSVDSYMADADGNYSKDATNNSTGDHPVVPVANKNGLTLPSTGGMGTILFTIFGVLIVALGAGWYVKSNKRSSGRTA